MTTNDIAAIRERAAKATPGPWRYYPGLDPDDAGSVESDTTWICGIAPEADGTDAAFIAAARTDIPNLCDEVEALRGELARAREALGAAIPLLQTHSCWHDVFPELDCCEYGLVAEQASVALGNEPLPIYAEHMAALRDAGRGEGE